MAFGGVKGTLTGTAISPTNPTNATGSVVVAVDDLIYAAISERLAGSSTGVTDNLGNVYTSLNSITPPLAQSTNASGHAFVSVVTVAGTLTQVRFAMTASSQDTCVGATVIEGPFDASPVDANPALVLTDTTTPYVGPATGTTAQADEVACAFNSTANGVTGYAISGWTVDVSIGTGTAAGTVSLGMGHLLLTSTGSVQPSWTATGSAAGWVLGTTSFKKQAAVGTNSGTLDAVEPDDDNPAFDGSVAWAGNIGSTEGGVDVAVFSAFTPVTGTLAPTEDPDVVFLNSSPAITGTLNAREATTVAATADNTTYTADNSSALTADANNIGDVGSFTGSIGNVISCVLAATEAADTPSFTGTVAWLGTLAATEAADVVAFTGLVGRSGTLAATEAADVVAFTGTVTWLGTFAPTDSSDVASFTGLVGRSGTIAATEALSDSSAFTGNVAWLGSLTAVDVADIVAFDGLVGRNGTIGATEAADTSNFSGMVLSVNTGTFSATETVLDVASFTPPGSATGTFDAIETTADIAFVIGNVAWAATLASTEVADTASFPGLVGRSGTLAATEASDVASFPGTVTWFGTLGATEGVDTVNFSALGSASGALAATEAASTAAFAGTVTWFGTFAATEAADVSALTGSVAWSGTIAAIEDPIDRAAFIALSPLTGTIGATEDPDAVFLTSSPSNFGTLNAFEATNRLATADTTLYTADNSSTLTADAENLGDVGGFTGTVATIVISGTLAATEIDTDVGAIAGLVRWLGTIAATEAASTASFTGLLSLSGTFGATEATDTANFVPPGNVTGAFDAFETTGDTSNFTPPAIRTGTFAATEAADVVFFLQPVAVSGTLAVVESADVVFITQSPDNFATLNAHEATQLAPTADTTIYTADTTIVTADASNEGDRGNFAGTVATVPITTGTIAAVEASDTANFFTPGALAGVLAAVEAAVDAASFAGKTGLLGTLDAIEAADFVNFSQSATALATLNAYEGALLAATADSTLYKADNVSVLTADSTNVGDRGSFAGSVTGAVTGTTGTFAAVEAADVAAFAGAGAGIGDNVGYLNAFESGGSSLTADSGVVKADSTLYTADADRFGSDTANFTTAIGAGAFTGTIGATEAPDVAVFTGIGTAAGTRLATLDAKESGPYGGATADSTHVTADSSLTADGIGYGSDIAHFVAFVGAGQLATLAAVEAADRAAFSAVSVESRIGTLAAVEGTSDKAHFTVPGFEEIGEGEGLEDELLRVNWLQNASERVLYLQNELLRITELRP